MPQAKGFMGRLVLDYETTFGSNPTTKAGKSLPFNTIDLAGKQNLIDTATITNNRNATVPGMGRIDVSGSVTIPMDVNAIGYWLKAMFGSVTPTGAGPYTYAFKVGNTQPSLVLEKGFTDIGQYFLYNGCKVNSFKLPFGNDGELVATMDFLGATETVSTTAYAASPTAIALDRINNFQGVIKEGGSTIGTITSGELNINFGLDGSQYTVGAGNARGDIPEGIVTGSGSLKALFTDATLLNKGINGTETSIELIYTSGTKSLSIKFPEVQFERTSPAISGPAGVGLDLNWRAFYKDDAGASLVIVTLINSTASY